MKAIVVRSFGGPSALQHVTNWPLPKAHENNVGLVDVIYNNYINL